MKSIKSYPKVAIIADIHANYYAFKTILADIEKRGIETILFLGDYITDGFENNAVLAVIQKYEHVIAGNRELSIINYDEISWKNQKQFKNMEYTYYDVTQENKSYLKSLPTYKIITLDGIKICLSHGTPYNPREIVTSNCFDLFDFLIHEYHCDVYLFAHTHESFCCTYQNHYFINPGSIILPADGPTSKYGILDLTTLTYEQIKIPYSFSALKKYYLESDYFFQNQEWCNLLIQTNETGMDYVCMFIDFIRQKAKKVGINIKNNIPNALWDTAFLEFMKIHHLPIY